MSFFGEIPLAELVVLRAARDGEVAVLAPTTAKHVKQGFIDAKAWFSIPKDREIRSALIQGLLTDDLRKPWIGIMGLSFKVHRRGVRIQGAQFAERIDLDLAMVQHETWLDACDFIGDFHAQSTTFQRSLTFDSSTFRGEFRLQGATVGTRARFANAIFHGPVDLGRANIGTDLSGNEARFLSEGQTANFNGIKIGGVAFLRAADFHGPVNFVGADIGRDLVADEAHFFSKDQAADFNGTKIGGTAFLRSAEFDGPIDFGHVNICTNIYSSCAQFRGKAIFWRMRAANCVYFDSTLFRCGVEFSHARIGYLF